ncbi:hypothetical protein FQR65_LT10813 [Abscondita terminalis]|nr:hypothetical protein FQR65_LT10813 [Abscondita terminalis]
MEEEKPEEQKRYNTRIPKLEKEKTELKRQLGKKNETEEENPKPEFELNKKLSYDEEFCEIVLVLRGVPKRHKQKSILWSHSPKGTTMTDRKAVIKNADMSEDMQQDAVDCATQAIEKYNIEKDIAAFIKKEFDKKYNPTWHCIVGRNFGSYVTHETRHFIYFYLGQVAILLFKSG